MARMSGHACALLAYQLRCASCGGGKCHAPAMRLGRTHPALLAAPYQEQKAPLTQTCSTSCPPSCRISCSSVGHGASRRPSLWTYPERTASRPIDDLWRRNGVDVKATPLPECSYVASREGVGICDTSHVCPGGTHAFPLVNYLAASKGPAKSRVTDRRALAKASITAPSHLERLPGERCAHLLQDTDATQSDHLHAHTNLSNICKYVLRRGGAATFSAAEQLMLELVLASDFRVAEP